MAPEIVEKTPDEVPRVEANQERRKEDNAKKGEVDSTFADDIVSGVDKRCHILPIVVGCQRACTSQGGQPANPGHPTQPRQTARVLLAAARLLGMSEAQHHARMGGPGQFI